MRTSWDRIVWPWLTGLVVAAALCSSYLLMFSCRKAWQSHYPTLACAWSNNGRFTVLGMLGTETTYEELAYAARAQEVTDHLIPFDPFIKENRSFRMMVPDYLTYRIIGIARLAAGDMSWAWLTMRFFCCWLWFILVYAICLELTQARSVSFFCASFVTCQSYILTFLFVTNLHWGIGWNTWLQNAWIMLSYGHTESVCRLPRPGLTYALLLAAILLAAKSADRKTWGWAAVSGVCGGLLSFVRMDIYSIYLAASWVFAWVYTAKNRFCWQPFLSAALTLSIGLPCMYGMFPIDADFAARFISFGHSPFLWVLPYLIIAYGLIRATSAPLPLFLASILIADFCLLNIRILTGHYISPLNWAYPGNICAFAAASFFLPGALRGKNRLWRYAATVAISAAFLQGVAFAAIHYPFYGLPKDYDAALTWLKRNTIRDSVVMTLDPEVDGLIPVFTHSKTALAIPLAMVSDFPLAANASRLLAILDFFGVKRDRFLQEFWEAPPLDRRTMDQVDRSAEVKLSLMSLTFFHHNPPNRTRRLLDEAARQPAALPDFDYVWSGDFERRYMDPQFAVRRNLKEIYRNPSVVLYERAATPVANLTSREGQGNRP